MTLDIGNIVSDIIIALIGAVLWYVRTSIAATQRHLNELEKMLRDDHVHRSEIEAMQERINHLMDKDRR